MIFIHELGHFLFAKWAGVKVERFSIGMGPIIWSRTIGETEYALSILPIGGYVKMLGQEDLPGQQVESKDERSFVNKHPAWKFAILFGGVLFNIVSSYLILLCLAWYGMPVFSPQVSHGYQYIINQDGEEQLSPARKHNLRNGDHILEINGNKVRSFTDLMMYTIADNTEPITLKLKRQGGEEYQVEMNAVYDRRRGTHTLGLELPRGLRIGAIMRVEGQEVALREGDRIIGIAGSDERFNDLQLIGSQLNMRLAQYVGQKVKLIIIRDGEEQEVEVLYAGATAADAIKPSLGPANYVSDIVKDSPAEKAGILPGDYVLAANGQRLINYRHLNGIVAKTAAAKQAVTVTVLRLKDGKFTPLVKEMHTTNDPHTGGPIIGISLAGTLHAGPVLSSSTDEQIAALLEVGIAVDDHVIKSEADISDEHVFKSLRSLVAKGGDTLIVPYTKGHVKALTHVDKLGFWEKLFGVKPKPSMRSRLYGSYVIKPPTETDSTIIVEQFSNVNEKDEEQAKKGDLHEINLIGFEPEQRKLFEDLQKGDVIIQKAAVDAEANPAFMVVRGVEREDIAWKEIPIKNAGAAIMLMADEGPYQLESWSEAFTIANEVCKNTVVTTLRIIPRFFKKPENGGIDASKSLSGPIGIFSGMKQKTVYFGFASFLKLLAFIGINLFLVNLLPIPIVDGGQIVFLAIEVVIRRPVPAMVIEVANYIGLLLIVALMIYILGIDIDREFLQ